MFLPYSCFFLLIINVLVITFGYDLKAFDDTNLFKINWPAKTEADLLDPQINAEPYVITTSNNEKYQCFLPQTVQEETVTEEEYTGANPIEFLTLLFNQNACSIKLESYWTYELCHGRYVHQYHEERNGKTVKLQKYELGKINSFDIMKLSTQYDELAKNPNKKSEIPVKKIEGVNMPYVEVEMTDGTVCDLNGKTRSIKVLYVCFPHGKQEIYSIKETATCEYEAIFPTRILCGHPDYKPQDTGENEINCHPLEKAKRKPRALVEMERESLKLRLQKVTDEKPRLVYAIFHVDKDGQDGQPQVRVEIHPVDSNGKPFNIDDTLNALSDQGISVTKSNSLGNFLSGPSCLNGGNGWWKYEFCYGRSVSQYHVESGGSKTVISLGVFDKEKHMEWIDANPHKKPKPVDQRKQLSHFYSSGSICGQTGKPRQTEVKLRCVTNSVGSPSSVSLYLIEPMTCEYVLGVESSLICSILEEADDVYGLINEKFLEKLGELKTNLPEDNDERIANGDE